jgi:hypothetical protein
VSETYGQPGHVPGDYDAACDAVGDGDFATIERHGVRVLVVATQQVSLAQVGVETWLVSNGSEIQAEIAAKARSGRKRWKATFEVGLAGAIVLDATTTVARAAEGAIARIAIAAGTYAIETICTEVGSTHVSLARLVPDARRPRARSRR